MNGAVAVEPRAARLAQAYGRVDRERMADLPFRHPSLAVEVVGLRFYEDALVGVLITPWCLNLVRLPADGAPCGAVGIATERRFPAGRFDFLGAEEAEVGAFEQCSLLSPVLELADQPAAREAAEAALAELFQPEGGTAPAGGPAPMSRRAFLRGGGD
jgi:[NiFe] hydrogenase assembly HybE family chaperone